MLLKMESSPPRARLAASLGGSDVSCWSFLQGDGQLVLCGMAAPYTGPPGLVRGSTLIEATHPGQAP